MRASLACVIRAGRALSSRLSLPSLSLQLDRLNRLNRLALQHQYQQYQLRQLRQLHKMSSDSAYAAFLDKANQGPDSTAATATDKADKKDDQDSGFIASKTLDVDEQRVPPSLRVDAFYSSETDEPFEPVVLALDHLPSEDEFPQLVHGSTAPKVQVSVLSPAQFDRRGQYTSVLEAVKAACSSTASASASAAEAEVRVYRVQHDHSRAEYWLLALDVDGGRLLGLKARAVET